MIRTGCAWVGMTLIGWANAGVAAEPNPTSPVLRSEFIYENAPSPQCHASTICALSGGGLAAAWFGGTREKHPDVGIWAARHENGRWTVPVEVANGRQPDGKRWPCWNPVLYQPKGQALVLAYKMGPSPSDWWGMEMTSGDGGKSWSTPRRLPAGILGPIKNKPVSLADGTLIAGSSEEAGGWRVHFERSRDQGRTWSKIGPINDGTTVEAIQPAILRHADGRLQALCRNRRGPLLETWSKDRGETWSPLAPTQLPNPNSGIDAVSLADGRHLLVYNHVPPILGRWGGARTPLNVAISADGSRWQAAAVLEREPGEYSYPAVIQSPDGLVHVTYTWKRTRIKHVVLDPARLQGPEIRDGAWPAS